MDWQNTHYALTQIVHNFGAVAVVGGALFGRWLMAASYEQRRRLAWLVLAGWIMQGISGATFGAISYYYYGEFPDIHGIAAVALMIKMACAAGGFITAASYLRFGSNWSPRRHDAVWNLLVVLAVLALSSAAILRWFS